MTQMGSPRALEFGHIWPVEMISHDPSKAHLGGVVAELISTECKIPVTYAASGMSDSIMQKRRQTLVLVRIGWLTLCASPEA